MEGLVSWVVGDVRNFPIGSEQYDIIVHAATDVVAESTPQDIFSTCIDGTRRVMELAEACGAHRMLLLSSGAVYGPQPTGMTHVPETYLGGLIHYCQALPMVRVNGYQNG
jgi:dTDP-glucose 4,6-dehydratase